MFLQKGVQAMVGFVMLNTTFGSKTSVALAKRNNQSHEEFIVSSIRGFKPADDPIARYRFYPHVSLLHFIYHRMVTFDDRAFQKHISDMMNCTSQLIDGGCVIPGSLQKNRSFWLYPMMTENRQLTLDVMHLKGVQANYGSTQLKYVAPDEGYPEAENTKWFMDHIVYLPL